MYDDLDKPSPPSFQEQNANEIRVAVASSPYAHAAPGLLRRGYSAIPLAARQKYPGQYKGPASPRDVERGYAAELGAPAYGRMLDWTAKTRDAVPDYIRNNWMRWPDANVGILLGAPSGNAFALDFDCRDDTPVAAEAARIVRDFAGPDAPERFGAKGFMLFCQFGPADPVVNAVYHGADGRVVLEVKSTGTQVVMPPSIHPDTGLAYQWVSARTLDEVEPDELPLRSNADLAALIEKLRAIGFIVEKGRANTTTDATDDEGTATGRNWLTGFALSDLDLWVPGLNLANQERKPGGWQATAHWRAGGTGRPLSERKRNLHLDAKGIRDFGDGRSYSPVGLVAAALDIEFAAAADWLFDKLRAQIDEALPPWQPGPRATATATTAEAAPTPEVAPQPDAATAPVVSLEAERARLATFVKDAAQRVENIKQVRQSNGATRRKIERLLTEAGTMPHGHARQALVAAARSLALTHWGKVEVHLADAQPGVGKTTAVVENVDSYVYFAPTTALAREHAAQSGAGLVVAQSGTDAKGKANCKRSGYLEPIRKAGGSQSMLCGTCQHRDFCPVVAALQAIKSAPRVVASHADLSFARDGVPVGLLPVIDEVPWSLEVGLGGHAIAPSALIPTDDPRSGHQWHALAAIRDAIEAHRAKYAMTPVEHLPEADLWGIPADDIAADMAELEHRQRERRESARAIVGKGTVALRKNLEFEAAKLGNVVADDRLRLQILQAADAVDDRFSLPPDHIVSGIAISGAGVQCVAPRKIHGQHLEAGVALFLTATPPPEPIVCAMFATAITFKGDGDDAPEITIEPTVEIVRFGARPIARPAENRIEIVTGAPITEGDRADVAKIERLAKVIRSAPAAPVVATESMRKLIGPMMPDADLRSFGKMVGLNEFKDQPRIEVVGYSRRRAEDAEAALVGWSGIWVPRRKWQAVVEHQQMTDGSVAPLRTSHPVPSRAYAELDFAPCGKFNLPGPLFGSCELMREDETGRAVANVWQAIERIRLLTPSSDDAGKVARVFADVVLPVPVDQVSAMIEAEDDAHIARLVAEIEGNWAPDPVCPIVPPTSAIPTSFEIAQTIGIVGEMDKNRWSKSMRKAQIGNPKNAYVLSIRISRIASSRIRTAAFGNWKPMLHRLAPQIAADQLSAKIGKPVLLHPEDALPRGAVPATAHMLRQLGYADTDADARQVEAQMKTAPDRRRFVAKITDGDDIARSLWLVPAELEPVEAIAATLSARLQGRSLVSVEEMADDEGDPTAGHAVLPMSREGIMSVVGISDRKARALVERLESADGRYIIKVKTATAKQALRFSVANGTTAEAVRHALAALGVDVLRVEGLQAADVAVAVEIAAVAPDAKVADVVEACGEQPAAAVEIEIAADLDPLAALVRQLSAAMPHLPPAAIEAMARAGLAAGAG
jgi:hypothetical protein